MQFIEANMFGVRAAFHRLRRTSDAVEVRLFPMIHIGAAGFYRDVLARLEPCDLVLYEGLKSWQSAWLTFSYRLAAKSTRLGLVEQRDHLAIQLMQRRKIRADSDAAEFGAAWERMPWTQRAALLTLAPAYGTWLWLTATKRSIGRRLSTEEVETHRDTARADDYPELDAMLHDDRDAHLIRELDLALAAPATAACIGVVYGAAHMRVVTRALTERHGFHVAGSEWLTVFDY